MKKEINKSTDLEKEEQSLDINYIGLPPPKLYSINFMAM